MFSTAAFQSFCVSLSVIVADVARPVFMCLDIVFSLEFFFYMAPKSVCPCAAMSFGPVRTGILPLELARQADSSGIIIIFTRSAVVFLYCYIIMYSLVLVGLVGHSLMVGCGGGGGVFASGGARRRGAR